MGYRLYGYYSYLLKRYKVEIKDKITMKQVGMTHPSSIVLVAG